MTPPKLFTIYKYTYDRSKEDIEQKKDEVVYKIFIIRRGNKDEYGVLWGFGISEDGNFCWIDHENERYYGKDYEEDLDTVSRTIANKFPKMGVREKTFLFSILFDEHRESGWFYG